MGIDIKDLEPETAATITRIIIKEQQKLEKKEHDRRLRNTMMLLINYRRLKLHIQTEPGDDELTMEYEEKNGVVIRFDEISKYHAKSRALIKYLDKILKVYKVECEEGSDADYRKYQVINKLYLTPHKYRLIDLQPIYDKDTSTLNKDKLKAIEDISVMLYGVEALLDKGNLK